MNYGGRALCQPVYLPLNGRSNGCVEFVQLGSGLGTYCKVIRIRWMDSARSARSHRLANPIRAFASRRLQRLTAMNAWTEPAGTAVAGSSGAGQLTTIVATDVDEFGGNRYVIFALSAASGGGDPFTVPVILPWFVK